MIPTRGQVIATYIWMPDEYVWRIYGRHTGIAYQDMGQVYVKDGDSHVLNIETLCAVVSDNEKILSIISAWPKGANNKETLAEHMIERVLTPKELSEIEDYGWIHYVTSREREHLTVTLGKTQKSAWDKVLEDDA